MKVIVTGGAGFIGCNAVERLLMTGADVVVVDNLSRKNAHKNLAWLRGRALGDFLFSECDVRDADAIDALFREHGDAEAVLHLAAQVAVTTSVTEPRRDFEINALGTLNVLEATRAHAPAAAFLYASTNKVYGGLEHLGVEEIGGQWQCPSRALGIDELQALDFHSPYGCSKGAADQYVRDYARIYGLKTVSFRQSCIYGPRQFGVEDQGWIAWLAIACATERPITIYGDGKQTRDVLFVDDLVDCYLAAIERIDRVKGQIFNVGGGPANVLSLHGLIESLERLNGRAIVPTYEDWRPGDQRAFVCDVRKAERYLGWAPKTSPAEGVAAVNSWVTRNIELFADDCVSAEYRRLESHAEADGARAG